MEGVTASFHCIFGDWKFVKTILSEFPGRIICFHNVFHSGDCLKW